MEKEKRVFSVVTGEAISGANCKRFFGTKDFTGEDWSYEEELSKARNIAFDEPNQKAREMGANGVVGIDIDYGTLGDTGSSGKRLMVRLLDIDNIGS